MQKKYKSFLFVKLVFFCLLDLKNAIVCHFRIKYIYQTSNKNLFTFTCMHYRSIVRLYSKMFWCLCAWCWNDILRRWSKKCKSNWSKAILYMRKHILSLTYFYTILRLMEKLLEFKAKHKKICCVKCLDDHDKKNYWLTRSHSKSSICSPWLIL